MRGGKTARAWIYDLGGRLWRGSGPVSGESAGRWRPSAAPMVPSDAELPASLRRRRGHRRASTTNMPHAASTTSAPGSWAGTCSARSADPGPTTSGRAGGEQSALSRAGVRSHPSSPSLAADGRRDDVPLRHRGHRGSARAHEAAGAQDVRLGGGVETIRRYLRAGLVDHLHLAVSPVILGSGENLLAGLDLPRLGYRLAEHVSTEAALHLIVERR